MAQAPFLVFASRFFFKALAWISSRLGPMTAPPSARPTNQSIFDGTGRYVPPS